MAYRDELEAALARAEAAERNLAAVCFIHPNVPSATACIACGRGICEPCTMAALEGAFCPACFARARARHSRRQGLLLVGSGVAILGAVVGLVLAMGKPGAGAPTVAEGRAEKARDLHAWKTKSLLAALAKEPCSRALALRVAETHAEDADHGKTLAFVDDFTSRCGVWPRLLWTKLYAHEQRGEWEAAAATATALIGDDPTDSDYWWWRGKAEVELGHLDQAAADFRQSMARRMNDEAVTRFARVMERQGRPCEGAFALRAYVDAYPDEDLDWATRRETELYMAGACQVLDGKGKATLRRKAGQPVVETEARVGDAGGRFAVDPASGYVVVTRAFAARAGLAPRDGLGALPVHVAGALRSGALAIADVAVGGATAPAVHVAVVDALPPGIDGVLGASLLQRFLVDDDRSALILTGPER